MRIQLIAALSIVLLGTIADARPKAVLTEKANEAVLAPKHKTLEPIMKPILSVKSIAMMPVGPGGTFAAGVHVMLDIRVKNTGTADSSGREQLQIQCRVLSGGPCPVTDSVKAIPAIPKGSDRSIVILAAPTTSPGIYEVTATPIGGTRGSGSQVTIEVKGKKLGPAGASPALGAAVLQTVKPDLQVEVRNPTSAGQKATIRVHNKSGTPTPQGSAFVVVTEIFGSCEAGKLVTSIPAAGAQQNVGVIPAGGYVDLQVQPASGPFGDTGCYYKIKARADTFHQVAETNEMNNSGQSLYCVQGASCY